jgi:hypothetical protein
MSFLVEFQGRFLCFFVSFQPIDGRTARGGVRAAEHCPVCILQARGGGAIPWLARYGRSNVLSPLRDYSTCTCTSVPLPAVELANYPQTHTQTQSRGAHVRARFWLSICLSVERDTFFSHRHTAETTVTSRVCFIRRVTRRPSVESHLHCTHRVPSTQGCPHATSPRAA